MVTHVLEVVATVSGAGRLWRDWWSFSASLWEDDVADLVRSGGSIEWISERSPGAKGASQGRPDFARGATIFRMAVAAKLNIKAGQTVVVEGLPLGVELGLEQAQLQVDAGSADAVILFVANAAEFGQRADQVVEAARRDALAWVAYPKAGKLGTDLNRDSLAKLMIERGVQPVRQVAIDDVWSALRFRPGL
jgi:hypothetical protein